jgi:hypothetical protein
MAETDAYLLKQDTGFLLLQSGDKIILESENAVATKEPKGTGKSVYQALYNALETNVCPLD